MVITYLLLFSILASYVNANITVKTPLGNIEGFVYPNVNGFRTEVFLGIPYAKPPVGELRFEKPQSVEAWNTTLQAKSYGYRCVSSHYIPNASEDCLTLNIIRPALPQNPQHQYPVLVWVHGGAFTSGSSADYSYEQISDILVSKGVIFVSINYRLGPFGFFSTGNWVASGNFGLRDQLEALSFIQKTISSFGGDPKRVTILGESAGGSSASWLTLHPQASNYFARAIILSGSSEAAWSSSADTLLYSRSLLQLSVCDEEKDYMSCMRRKSVEVLQNVISIVQALASADSHNGLLFHPRYDNEFTKGTNFETAIQSASKIPVIMGLNSQEAIPFAITDFSIPTSQHYPIPPHKLTNYTRDDLVEAITDLVKAEKCFVETHDAAAQRVIQFYDNQTSQYPRNPYLQTFVQLISDIQFNVPMIREAQHRARMGQSVYFYRHSFVPDESKNIFVEGAGHGGALYNFIGPKPAPNTPAATVQATLLDLFMNFIKTGQPLTNGYGLRAANPDSVPFADINVQSFGFDDLWPQRVAFWDQMAKEFGYDWPSGICNNQIYLH